MPKIRSSTEFLRAYFLYCSSLSFVPLMFSGFQFLFPINMQMSFSLLHLSFSDVLSLDSYGQLSKLDYRIGGIFFLSLSRIISQSCISFLFFLPFLTIFHSIFAIQLIQSTTRFGKGKKNNDGLVESSYN